MRSLTLKRRIATGVGALALMTGVVAAFSVASVDPGANGDGPGVATAPEQHSAVAPDVPPAAVPQQAGAEECCRSRITQDLVDRNPLPGGGYELVIEATLDSNAVCHVLLLQCVVEPEVAPTNMTLQSVECLSPRWANINVTLPVVGDVDVCARFDHNRAGQDQKFRFTYTTPQTTGTVSETVRFFRFPEEIFFIRAENTITIDLGADVDILEECPDTAEVGTQVVCNTRVEVVEGTLANASVTHTPPAQLTGGVSTTSAAGWSCVATTCTNASAGVGVYSFATTYNVGPPIADVEECATVSGTATTPQTSCDTITIFEASDTFAALEMGVDKSTAPPGAPLVWTVTFTNDGDNPLEGARLVNDTLRLATVSSIQHVGGAGAWTCRVEAGTPICDLDPGSTIPVGASAIFELRGTLSPSAVAGDVATSEVEVTYANDPFGPDFPLRDGVEIEVVAPEPTFTG